MRSEQRGGLSERPRRYSSGAIVLHWAIAIMIVSNIVVGVRMRDMEGVSKLEVLQVHESIGLSVLILSVIRIAWRIAHRPPPLPIDARPWERWLIRCVHVGLYLIMFALPLSGWIIVSGRISLPSISLFGIVPWPWFPMVRGIASDNPTAIGDISVQAHVFLGRITLVLVLLHLAGAIKHMAIRDGTVWRMLPLGLFLPRRSNS